MERRLKVALIGCGSIGREVHLPLLRKSSKVEVVAVIDTSVANNLYLRLIIKKL